MKYSIILNEGVDRFFQFKPSTAKLSLVYTGEIQGDSHRSLLDEIYEIHNCRHPEGYLGKYRSVSMGDIIQVDNSFFSVEIFGFSEVPSDQIELQTRHV